MVARFEQERRISPATLSHPTSRAFLMVDHNAHEGLAVPGGDDGVVETECPIVPTGDHAPEGRSNFLFYRAISVFLPCVPARGCTVISCPSRHQTAEYSLHAASHARA